MPITHDDILERVLSLRTHRKGNRRAIHKPLLLLFAVSRLQDGQRSVPFDDVKTTLDPLLHDGKRLRTWNVIDTQPLDKGND